MTCKNKKAVHFCWTIAPPIGESCGFDAMIFQHEFRHLMNGTYLDVAKHFLSKTELDHEIEMKKTPFFETASDTLPLLINDYTVGETLENYHSKK